MTRWLSSRPALLAMALAACGAPAEPKSPPAVASAAKPGSTQEKPIEKSPTARRDPLKGPDGEVASLAGTQVKIVSPGGAEELIEARELHPPPGDRSLVGISPTALLFLDDGALLVGMGDGTVAALDRARRRRYSIGFRGAIRGLVPAGEGLVAVTTQRGVIALITREGELRWERQITAERLSPAVVTPDHTILAASQRGVFALTQGGDLRFSHASRLLYRNCGEGSGCPEEEVPELELSGDEIVAARTLRFRLADPHPAVPSLEPTFPLTFRRVLDETVSSILATGPNEVSALVTRRKYRSDWDWGEDDPFHVVRIEGGKMTRLPVPHVASKSEVFLEGSKAVKAPLFIDALVAGPDGSPWILARRFNVELSPSIDSLLSRFVGAGQILELRGGAIRERNDLFKAFSAHALSDPIAAAPQGTAGLFCFGHDRPTCAVHDGPRSRLVVPPGRVSSVARLGDASWILTEAGKIYRNETTSFAAIEQPEGAAIRGIAGTSEKDVWADFEQRYAILHHDGERWTEVAVPTSVHAFKSTTIYRDKKGFSVAAPHAVHGLFARAKDDAWAGRLRWDGARWSIVHGAPVATAALARAKDDVWLGNARGLWHGTAPGPSPVRLPPPARPDEGAIPAAAPLPLEKPAAGFAVERMSLAVAKGAPLTAAKNVSAAPDGTLWLQAWDRVVEVERGGKARTLRREGRASFGRWAYPEARGRGTLLGSDAVQRIDVRADTREEVQLDHHDVVAVHGDARGSTWVVGAASPFTDVYRYEDLRSTGQAPWEELAPHALVRASEGAGFQPVLGLPSAAWCDVAATPDGGAWFAGGLNQGPVGEGILFHARGKLGSEATARYRAPASLLAVTAVGSDDAWAVGAAGAVIRVRGGAVTRLTLPSGEWLRAVHAAGPDDVWIGGDGGTLLHHDGRGFRPVQHPLGANAAFTGIVSSKGATWAVGPSGILRITRRP